MSSSTRLSTADVAERGDSLRGGARAATCAHEEAGDVRAEDEYESVSSPSNCQIEPMPPALLLPVTPLARESELKEEAEPLRTGTPITRLGVVGSAAWVECEVPGVRT